MSESLKARITPEALLEFCERYAALVVEQASASRGKNVAKPSVPNGHQTTLAPPHLCSLVTVHDIWCPLDLGLKSSREATPMQVGVLPRAYA